MIPVSSEFLLQMWTDRSFHYSVVITFADNRTVTLTEDDLLPVGCHITTSAGVNSFPLGNAFCKVLELQFFNLDGRFADYDFYMARVAVTLSYVLSETTEPLNLGTYTVTEPETYGTIITIKAYDRMYKADKPFSGSITFPTTAGLLFAEACYDAGLSPLRTDFNNNNFVINSLPENITNRQIIAGCAQIAGGNALIKNLAVAVAAYNPDDLAPITTYYGGVFDDATPYATGDSVSGGSFVPWDDPVADGGTFEDFRFQQIFTEVIRQTTCTDDVIITGIQTKTEDGTEVLSGNTGYVLSITNPLIVGREQAAVNAIGSVLNGMRFRPFELETMAYPLAEFGDIVYIMNGDRLLTTLVTDIEFNLKGVTKLKCSADAPLRNSSKNYVGDISSSTLQAARQQTAGQISRYNTEITRLTELIANSYGAYQTEETLADGSKVYYMHDEPDLSHSQNIWKRTAQGFLVSNDKGRTWNSGMDSSGHLVVNILSAVGINADWINAGHISADKIQGGHISADLIEGGHISADLIQGGHISADLIQGGHISADLINTGHMSADRISGGHISADLIQGGHISANLIDSGTLSANRIKGGTLTLNGNAGGYGKLDIKNAAGTSIITNNNKGLTVTEGGTITCRLFVEEYEDDYVGLCKDYREAKLNNAAIDFGKTTETPSTSSFSSVGRLQARFSDETTYPINSRVDRIDLAFRAPDNPSEENGCCLSFSSFKGSRITPYMMMMDTTYLYNRIHDPNYVQMEADSIFLFHSNAPKIAIMQSLGVAKNLYVNGSFYVDDTANKHKVISTNDYARRLMYCYETSAPYFGDIGTGQTDENGECYVFFDDIFRETIVNAHEYAVFLQKEGPGDLWVAEKTDGYFVVKGAADTPFSWELKAKQKYFADERLEKMPQEDEYEETIPDDGYTEPDYEAEGAQLIEDYINEQEDIPI